MLKTSLWFFLFRFCILQLRVVLGVPDNTTLLQPSDHIIVLMQWDTAEADKVKAE